jgi:hypothetical protein
LFEVEQNSVSSPLGEVVEHKHISGISDRRFSVSTNNCETGKLNCKNLVQSI